MIVRVCVRAERFIARPIIGFFVKDRLGQTLFGDNTCALQPGAQPRVEAGNSFEGVFTFQMPVLLPGEYTLAAAIADGEQREHRMLHWVHDATMFVSQAMEHHRGIVGIAMEGVTFRLVSGQPSVQ